MSDLSSSDSAAIEATSVEIQTLADEINDIDLGDPRRNRRAGRVLEQLGRQPQGSIPSAIGGWSETRSAYNLLAHDQVTAQQILEPHDQSTLKRIKQYPVVLVAQDTTELEAFLRQVERIVRRPAADRVPLTLTMLTARRRSGATSWTHRA